MSIPGEGSLDTKRHGGYSREVRGIKCQIEAPAHALFILHQLDFTFRDQCHEATAPVRLKLASRCWHFTW